MDRRWKVLAVISVGSFMAFLDAPIVSVAFPAIQKTFATTSPTALAWVIDVYFIAFAAFLVVGGRTADRFGRRRVFLIGMWVFTIDSLLCGLAPSAGALIAARAVQAVAAAIVVPAGTALLLVAFAPEDRRKAIGILAALIAVATSLAPTVGALIVEGPGWRWIFYVNVFVGLMTIIRASAVLDRDAPDPNAGIPDALGSMIQASALSLLVLGILKIRGWGAGDPRTIVAFAAAIVGLALFVERCRHHPTPVLDPELFRSRAFSGANLASTAFAVTLYAGTINSVLYFTNVWRLSILTTGLAFAPAAAVSILAGALAGRLVQRYGPRVVTAAGALGAAAGLVLISLSTGIRESYVAAWLPGQVLYTVGILFALSGAVGTALTSAPPSQFALASGINAALRQVGGAIGVAITLAIIGGAVGATAMNRSHTVFLIGAASLIVGGAITVVMGPARERLTSASTPSFQVGVDQPTTPEP